MNASLAANRTALRTLVLFAIAVATAAPATASIIDSFTDPLPMNPSLPATGARILFVGSRCDGAECPPGTIVTNEYSDIAEPQSGLPGVLAPIRHLFLATYFEPNPGGSGVLTIDPLSGGRLSVTTPGGPGLAVGLKYGDDEHHMNLDLRAGGSDRLEIEIPATTNTAPFYGLQVNLILGQGMEGTTGAPWASYATQVFGPGLLVIPYAALTGRFEEFDHDVDFLKLDFHGIQPGELVLGEIRTAAGPTVAEASSWGRIKSAYRR
jgi:hypothetical protein